MKLILATQNQGKVKEAKSVLSVLGMEIISAKEAGLTDEITEDKLTFRGNAFKKAASVAKKTRLWTIGDDSGICIKALRGAPGVFSARWAGKNATAAKIVKHTLKKMKGIPLSKRQAYFSCILALVSPQGKHWFFEGRVYGKIPVQPLGRPRPKLPYDVIFIPNGLKKSFAQMTNRAKNKISHRGLAYDKLKRFVLDNNLTKVR